MYTNKIQNKGSVRKMSHYNFSKVTPAIENFAEKCISSHNIDPELYVKYDVKRGLRDLNGKGVLAGLTDISEVCSSKIVDGQSVPCDGKLFYRGIDVEELVDGFITENRFGFEEATYLLLLHSIFF